MADSLEPLRRALAGRYTLEREIGRGGNAVVYLATDAKHDRKVAVKVLSPELAFAVRTERFFREIQLTAKLNHPHILPLIDSGQAGESLFYVMPYVEGESLRERLQQEKQLPLADALQIAREVADALGYAHGQGVVHRDIKPENILLHAGHAVVMDFGIARALTVAGGQTLTETGVAVGTPAYMSPEQGSGGQVDARSDIYSLGCVVYEMLAGHPPFSGHTVQEILYRHALDPVPSLKAARRGANEAIEQAVVKALAKDPADRPASAGDFLRALESRPSVTSRRSRWLPTAAAILVLVGGVALAVPRLRDQVFSRARLDPSVAVLRCENLSADPQNEYVGEGIADDLIDLLSRVPGLSVRGRTSSFSLKGDNAVEEAWSKLHVATVVECTVRRVGSSLRLRATLLRAPEGDVLWSHTYARELQGVGDLLNVQSELAGAVALQVTRHAGIVVAPSHTTDNMDAFTLYQQGRYQFNKRTAETIQKAVQNFQQAIKLDSGYAQAYAGLAGAYVVGGQLGYFPRNEAWPKAKEAATKATQLDSNLADAFASLGRVQQSYDWDLARAGDSFRRALRLNPSDELAHGWYAYLLSMTGNMEEAITEAERAVEIDRLSATSQSTLGDVLRVARRYGDAIQAFTRALDLEPRVPVTHASLGWTYAAMDRYEEALKEFQTAEDLGASGTAFLSGRGYVYARTGRRAEATRIAGQLEDRKRWESAAAIYLGLDDSERALHAIEKAIDERSFPAGPNFAGRVFDPIRTNPRFKQLLVKAGVAERPE